MFTQHIDKEDTGRDLLDEGMPDNSTWLSLLLVVLLIIEPGAGRLYNARFRGSSVASLYSSPSGPIAVTCVTYSPDFAQ